MALHGPLMVPALAAVVLAVSGTPARAQHAWFFEVTYSDPAGVINSPDDTAHVSLWASFEPDLYAFAAGALNIAATDPLDAGAWSDLEALLTGWDANDGTAQGGTVEGIYTWQFCFERHVLPDPSNPIEAWRGVWRTDVLHSRQVPLTTATSEYDVYTDEILCEPEDFVGLLTEGEGVIVIVGCVADCDGSGGLDLFDFLCFVNRYNAGDPFGDCTGEGDFDFFDFVCFINEFNAGC